MDNRQRAQRPLKIAISGASGFIGSALVDALNSKGYSVIRLVRKRAPEAPDEVCFDPNIKHIETKGLDDVDVVINLSGKSVRDEKWSPAVKTALKDSRLKTTTLLSHSLSRLKNPPRLFLSASAIGFYGNRGEEVLTEEAKAGTGFLAQLCREWELATWEAEAIGTTVNHLRFGVVLSKDGGALAQILPKFKLFLGAVLGNGEQYISWITRDDLIRAIIFLIENPQPTGPFNLVAPTPVTNKEFTKAIASAVHRPALLTLSPSLIRRFFGEMGETLLLDSMRVAPTKLLKAGFKFQSPDLSLALKDLLK